MSAESGTESIEIKASPERILQVVSDVDSYPKWMDAAYKTKLTPTNAETAA